MELTIALIVGSLVLTSLAVIPVLRSVGILGPRKKVLANGQPGQATLLGITPTGTVVNDINYVCRLQLRVQVPGRRVYDLETKETVPITSMAMLIPGSTLAVKVDATDPKLVFVDWQRGIAHPNQPLAPDWKAQPGTAG